MVCQLGGESRKASESVLVGCSVNAELELEEGRKLAYRRTATNNLQRSNWSEAEDQQSRYDC